MYSLLVFNGIDAKYILDEMELWEAKALVNRIELKHKDSWEQTRMITFMLAQVNSTKRLKMNDIMQLPWDNEKEATAHNTTISNHDIARLRERANNYLRNKQQ